MEWRGRGAGEPSPKKTPPELLTILISKELLVGNMCIYKGCKKGQTLVKTCKDHGLPGKYILYKGPDPDKRML